MREIRGVVLIAILMLASCTSRESCTDGGSVLIVSWEKNSDSGVVSYYLNSEYVGSGKDAVEAVINRVDSLPSNSTVYFVVEGFRNVEGSGPAFAFILPDDEENRLYEVLSRKSVGVYSGPSSCAPGIGGNPMK